MLGSQCILKHYQPHIFCRYEPFVVAEAGMGSSDPAGEGGAAFRTLAGYLFGKNAAGERMAMTAPVISDTRGVMQFFVGGGRQARRLRTTRPSGIWQWVPAGAFIQTSFADHTAVAGALAKAFLPGVRAPGVSPGP